MTYEIYDGDPDDPNTKVGEWRYDATANKLVIELIAASETISLGTAGIDASSKVGTWPPAVHGDGTHDASVPSQTDLDNHAGTIDAHHTRYADSEAQAAVEGVVNIEDLVTASTTVGDVARSQGDGTLLAEPLGHTDLASGTISTDDHHTNPTAGTGLVDESDNQFGMDIAVSGSATLASGVATVDTGVATTTTATFQVALGPQTADADITSEIRADSGTGTYVVDIEETDTNVGNPDVNYDVIRIR